MGLTFGDRLALYFPLVSIINLFIYVLKYPSLPTMQSDISLIDVAVGHFARLEFASSELSFPFTKEIARLARVMELKGKNDMAPQHDVTTAADELAGPSEQAPGYDIGKNVRRLAFLDHESSPSSNLSGLCKKSKTGLLY